MSKIAEFPLNEGSGVTAADSIASFDGELQGSASWASGGVKGSAYAVSFEAPGKIHIPDILTVGIGINFGATAWVYRTASSSGRNSIFSPEFSSGSFEFCLCCANFTNNKFALDYGSAYVVGYSLAADTEFSLNQWYHIAATARFNTVSIANCVDNGAGAIRVSTLTNHGFTTGRAVRIRDVSGTTEANGSWIITVIDDTTFDLDTSTFTEAYTSGGSVCVGEVEFWVDKVSQGVVELDVTIMGSGDAGDDWNIGAQEDNHMSNPYAFQFTDGKVDLVTLYDSALTQEDVDESYGDGPGSPPSPIVTLSVSTTSIVENGGTATVYALLDETTSETVTVSISFTGVAVSDSDYTLSTDTITIASGETSGSITVTGVDDFVYEGDETFTASITSVTGGGASASTVASTSEVTIVDDDSAPTVTISASPTSINENGGTSTVIATLSNPSTQNVTINLGFTGTATNNSDYSRSDTSITITAGNTSGSITVSAINDATFEGNETVIVDVTGVTNGTENGSQQVTITITEDDSNTVTLDASQLSINEINDTVEIYAYLVQTQSENVIVDLVFSGTATEDVDYSKSSSSILILSGQTSGSITLLSLTDAENDPDETVIVDIDSVTNAVESGTQQLTITIREQTVQRSQSVGLRPKLGLGL